MRWIAFIALQVTVTTNFISHSCKAQMLTNGSFEGVPTTSVPPPNWYACNEYSTPDTQPGSWNVSKQASEGSTYISLTTRGINGSINDNTVEAIGIKTNSALLPKVCYKLSIDLAFSTEFYFEAVTYSPVVLKIYASKTGCAKTSLVWTSPLVSHSEWQTYDFTFNVNDTYTDLVLEAAYNGNIVHPGNILVDNIKLSAQELNIRKTPILCENGKIDLDTGFPAAMVLWNTGATHPLIEVNQPGSYWVEVQERNCLLRDTVHINFAKPLLLDLGEDKINLCQGDSLILDVSAWPGKYTWSNGSLENRIVIKQPGIYSVTVDNGCEYAGAEIEVSFSDNCCEIKAPNVITPNGDTLNDYFEISSSSNIGRYNLKIFNRWGTLIFESNTLSEFWDGKVQNADEASYGIYYWQVKMLCITNNEIIDNEYKGTVSVVR